MTRLTDDREYTQDEGETVDLVIWEEWVNWESSKNGGRRISRRSKMEVALIASDDCP
jgi:hypothetical protein